LGRNKNLNELRMHKIGRGAMELAKRLHFLIAQGGTRTIGHVPVAEGLSFQSLERRIYDRKLRNKKKIYPSVQ
jgi:hypothetical protein